MDLTLRAVPFVGPKNQVELKRRIRRGTQSCWECKRRKVRCNLATSTNATCDGCRQRKTKCVSQEYPGVATKPDGIDSLNKRVSHLEAVIRGLTRVSDPICAHKCSSISISPNLGNVRASSASSVLTLPSSYATSYSSTNASAWDTSTESEALSSLAPAVTHLVQRSSLRNRVHSASISQLLMKAWPSPQNLDIIFNLPDQSLGLLHGTLCAPSSSILDQKVPSLRNTMRPPVSDCHPILIARKLLTLASYLQNLSPKYAKSLENAGVDYRRMMSLAVQVVRDCVISDDELLDSIEGIECIMIESMFQNNAGNLRSAWHSVHRAILIARAIGLHRGNPCSASKFLEPESCNRIRSEYMWFRLIQMNRYLSMMLGLLQETSSDDFANHQILEDCSPVDRMQRIDCAAAGYILQRNEAGMQENITDQIIGRLLQESAASVPPSWWLMPDISSGIGNDMRTLEKIVRVMDQLTHYHLVVQHHLPYVINLHTDCDVIDRKAIAADASREILARFTHLCTVHVFSSFCRGVSYLAFIACVVLCIVHVDAQHQRQNVVPGITLLLDLLVHQHPKDRGLMEVSLQNMRQMAHSSKDSIASKLVDVLHQLLSVEAEKMMWRRRVAGLVEGQTEHRHGCDGKLIDSGQVLEIFIPHIGMILFERDSQSTFVQAELFTLVDDSSAPPSTEMRHVASSKGPTLKEVELLRDFDAPDCIGNEHAAYWPIGSSSQDMPYFDAENRLNHFTSAINLSNISNDSWSQGTESLGIEYTTIPYTWDASNLDANCSEVFL